MNHYDRLRVFAWRRAHQAKSQKWRTLWFDAFDMADTMAAIAQQLRIAGSPTIH